jgi:hypothetical protein
VAAWGGVPGGVAVLVNAVGLKLVLGVKNTWRTGSAAEDQLPRVLLAVNTVGWRAGVKRVCPGHSVPEHGSLHRAHAGLWIPPRHLTPHRVRARCGLRDQRYGSQPFAMPQRLGTCTGELHRPASYPHPHDALRTNACMRGPKGCACRIGALAH